MAVKQMPQNNEAEMSVLGVCFLNKYALEKVCEEVNDSMFYNEANKKKMESVPEGAENHLDKLGAIENLLSLYPLVEVTGYDFKVNSITLNCSCPDEIEFYALKNSEEFKALSGNATSIRNEKFTMKFTFDNTGKQGR